jgi:hypothetical protein
MHVENAPCFDKTSDNHTKHDARIDFPVIVTAASSNHYYESQALLKSIHSNLLPQYTQIKVILYAPLLDKHILLMFRIKITLIY